MKKVTASYRVEYSKGFYGELVATSESSRFYSKFDIAPEESFHSYSIRGLALKTGSIVYQPTYVVITKDTPGTDAIDTQFMRNMQNAISRFKKVPFERGSGPMMDLINRATGKKFTDDPSKINIGETEEEDVLPLPQGIKVFEGGGEFTTIIDSAGNIDYTIRSIIAAMELAAKPLVENNLIDYYSIQSKIYGDKFVGSQNFESKKLQIAENESTHIGYFKYVAQSILSKYPYLLGMISDLLQFSNFGKINAQNKVKVDIKNSKFVRNMIDEGGTFYAKIIDNMLRLDDVQLANLEKLAAFMKQNKTDPYSVGVLIGLFDDNDRFQEEIEDFQTIRGPMHLEYFLNKNIVGALENAGYGRKLDIFMSHLPSWAEGVINSAFDGDTSAIYVLNRFIKNNQDIYELSDDSKKKIESIQKDIERQKAKESAEIARLADIENEKARLNTLVLNFETAYMDLNSENKFINMRGEDSLGEYLYKNRDKIDFTWFDVDRFESQIIDEAYSTATEEMGIRPSETYGEDADQVNDDIEYYAEDFLEYIDFFESEDGEKYAEDADFDASKFVLQNEEYRNDFIEYRKEELREDEGDWEPDNSSITENMDKIGPKILEEMGYDNGLMVAVMSVDNKYSSDNLTLYLDSKYIEQAKKAIGEIVQINASERYMEYSLSSLPVELWLVDKDQSIRVGMLGNIKFASGWYARTYKLGDA